MTAHAKSLEVGDRVKLGDRTGIIELIVSDIFEVVPVSGTEWRLG